MATPPQLFKAEVVSATQFEGYMTVWNHASCIFKKKAQIKLLEDIEGIDNLRWDDQQKVRAYFENSAPSCGGDSAKGVADGDYAIEATKSSQAACKSCNEKIEKGQYDVKHGVYGIVPDGQYPDVSYVSDTISNVALESGRLDVLGIGRRELSLSVNVPSVPPSEMEALLELKAHITMAYTILSEVMTRSSQRGRRFKVECKG
ncbi:hypothetical protein GOP47_0021615 [Adiantum capillus-veneris]|uniref:PARP-type domain-containing protein n=1 Tax=Adiantum capillus-veneris TaxID=13818 RepID=A0A9D4Z5E8_ADICA|nr:hypothetical protein GOP47_0021615 [Adiantum capillus-veneris]